MAGAFSGHLLNTFNNVPAQPSTPTIVTSGVTSFDARAHSTFGSSLPHMPLGFTPLTEDSTTAKHIATLQAKLNKKLGPEYISQRPGPGGGPKLTYAEGWKIINLANEVFGFNGWSSSIVSITTDYVDYSEESKRFNIGVTAIVRVTLRDGVYHEDVGYGLLENAKSKGGALDKCKKEAITDALKRTLRNFGNLLGNCLYDKSYAQEVVKIKVPPAKFDKNDLYRRPEFEERTPEVPVSESSSTKPRTKTEHEQNEPETLIAYVPRHLRQEVVTAAHQAQTTARALSTLPHRTPTHVHGHAPTSGSGSGSSMTDASVNRGPSSVSVPKPNGLTTPIYTPAQIRHPPPRAPPPRAISTSPLARVHSAPERSISFAEPMPPPPCADSTDVVDQDTAQAKDNSKRIDEDEDAFPLSTQDDAFLATVDLGEGDLGRPIDFEEGMGGVSMVDVSVLESGPDRPGRSPVAASPQLQPQVCDHPGNGSSIGLSSSGGPPKTNAWNDVQARHPLKPIPLISGAGSTNATNVDSSASAGSEQPRPLPRGGPPNTSSTSTSTSISSTSSPRVGPLAHDVKHSRLATTNGFHLPSAMGQKPPAQQQVQQHTPKPVVAASACARTTSRTPPTGPTNDLKRNADAMQAGSGSGSGSGLGSGSSSTRPPLQGMGLAQREQHYRHHQQPQRLQQSHGSASRPQDNSEGNDLKRLKR